MNLSVIMQHDPGVVGIAAGILTAASLMFQPMLQRAVRAHKDVAYYWIALTGIIVGGSVWSVHFTAMLGFRPHVTVAYLQEPTVLSLLIAMGSMTGVVLAARRFRAHLPVALIGFLFTLSVAWMHYTGMEGMAGLSHSWNYLTIFGTIVVGTVTASVALSRTLDDARDGVAALPTLMFCLCILSVHFGGMAAMDHSGHLAQHGTIPEGAIPRDNLLLPILAITTLVLTLGIFGYLLDARQSALFEMEQQRLRETNHVTGLANEANLKRTIQQLSSENQPFHLCGFSISRYQRIRPTHGDDAAKSILENLASRLTSAFQDSFVAQGNEDRFYVLTPQTEDATDCISARVLECFLQPFQIDERAISLRPCIGTTSWPDGCQDLDGLLSGLEFAIDQSAEAGPGTATSFDDTALVDLRYLSHLAFDLEKAIGKGQLLLHYQPQMAIQPDGAQILAAEALIRWQHPDLGLVRPDIFLPLAQENGLMTALGQWVLQTACEDAVRWHRPIGVAVNVDPVQLRDHSFVDTVRTVLSDTGLSPDRLELEVTETGIIHDIETAGKVLREIRTLGVRTALDDYGAGYSSLRTLYHIPFDTLKLDRGFVADVATKPEALRIVRAVKQMGAALGLTLLAEGIESKDQFRILEAEGFHVAQGYLFSRPIPRSEIEINFDLLQDRQLRA